MVALLLRNFCLVITEAMFPAGLTQTGNPLLDFQVPLCTELDIVDFSSFEAQGTRKVINLDPISALCEENLPLPFQLVSRSLCWALEV